MVRGMISKKFVSQRKRPGTSMAGFEAFKRCVGRNKIISDIPELATPQGSFLLVQRQHLGVVAMFETTLKKEENCLAAGYA
jgi:hypothetical protein